MQAEYAKVQRHYSTDFRGNMHAKCLRVDKEMLLGSANWTTASRGNYEMVVKLMLNDEGKEKAIRMFEECWERATPLTREDYEEATCAKAALSGGSSSSTRR